ncbi:hypothetical protein KIN20_027261 [Parelaphostrongylus tenuis]|uniref:Uncharacterized protein n=1 Tax=Parelaphostrongylus tenuis TaxID=148309 RepID=A0AAD5QZD0_PARTN|nr:hypothetical protein KIN20_027261 [Parelaphostrongylus tenuis]
MNEQKCIIVDNTVTGFCNGLMAIRANQMMPCSVPVIMMVAITPIPQNHTTISGTLSVRSAFFLHEASFLEKESVQNTNIVMANWSRSMWQSVVDIALRMLVSAPFGSHFFSATATVGGN